MLDRETFKLNKKTVAMGIADDVPRAIHPLQSHVRVVFNSSTDSAQFPPWRHWQSIYHRRNGQKLSRLSRSFWPRAGRQVSRPDKRRAQIRCCYWARSEATRSKGITRGGHEPCD